MLNGFLQSIRGGLPIVFVGGAREYAELVTYEHNYQSGKVRLYLNFAEKFQNKQTGFHFDAEKDFDPPLSQINWQDMGTGVLICWKSSDGREDGRPSTLIRANEQISNLRRIVEIYQKEVIEFLRVLEKHKVKEARVEEVFENAQKLRALRNLVLDPVATENKSDNPLQSLLDAGGQK